MENVGTYKSWAVFRCKDGHLEGFKNIGGKREGKQGLYKTKKGRSDRVVTTATTMIGFIEQVTKIPKKKETYNPYEDEKQLKIY